MAKNLNISLETSKKISWAQYICSLIVMTNHSFDYLGFGNGEKDLFSSIIYFLTKMFSSSFTWIAMQTFFTLSGILMFKDWNERKNTRDWYFRKIKGRVKSLLVPYLLWNAIWTGAFIAMGLSGKIENNIDAAISFSNIFKGVVLAKYNEVFWFMKVVMIYVVLSPIIGLIINSKYGIICLVITSFLATNVIPIKGLLGELAITQTFYNLFFYWLGAFISIKRVDFISKSYSKQQSIAWTGIGIVVLAMLQCSKDMDIFLLPNYIVLLVCASGVYSFWIAIDFVKKLKIYTFVDYSFLNYALHKPIQQLYNKIIAMLLKPSLIGYLINLFGGVLVVVIIIAIFVKIASKITPHLLGVLNGGRKISDAALCQ